MINVREILFTILVLVIIEINIEIIVKIIIVNVTDLTSPLGEVK